MFPLSPCAVPSITEQLTGLNPDQHIRIEPGELVTDRCGPANDHSRPPGYVAMDVDNTLTLCNVEVVDMTSSRVVVHVRGVRMSHPLGGQ